MQMLAFITAYRLAQFYLHLEGSAVSCQKRLVVIRAKPSSTLDNYVPFAHVSMGEQLSAGNMLYPQ